MEAGAVFLTVELPASANPVLFHERTGIMAADASSLSAARDLHCDVGRFGSADLIDVADDPRAPLPNKPGAG